MMHRRTFLGAGFAGMSALAWPHLWAQNAPNFGAPTLPAVGFKKFKLGAMEIIALNDGAVRRPLGAEFVTNAALDEVKALLTSQNLPTDYIDIPFNPFVIVSGGQRFLIDTGFADNGPPTTGRLRANMAAAGLQPTDINHVIISHYHGDHILGLRNKDGSLVYPNATVHVPAPEHAFWTDDARMNAAPEAMRGAFMAARRSLGDLSGSKLNIFQPGTELAPGIGTMAAFGHTPGMTMITAQSEGQSFMYLADLTNVPALFARNPDWAVAFDMDAAKARETRRAVFERVVSQKMMVGGFHFPFPSTGTFQASGNGYQFVPAA